MTRVAARFLSLFAVLCLAAPVVAQPIHGHPQKASYASPAEYKPVSCQTHWAPGENPVNPVVGPPFVLDLVNGTFGNSTIAHAVHLDLIVPLYAEVSGPITYKGAIKQFHFAGISALDPNRFELYRDLVWDETGSSTPPDLRGDPNGLKTHGFTITMDPTRQIGGHSAPLHGWFAPELQVLNFFDNGDQTTTSQMTGFFSMLDPNVEERVSYPLVSCRSTSFSSRRPEKSWGITFAEIGQFLPLAPIGQAWPVTVSSAGYGAIVNDPATLELKTDMDLHMGVPGRVLWSTAKAGDIFERIPIDPAQFGLGTRNAVFIRTQPDAMEMVASLLVFPITVADVPPLPTCNPGFHVEGGVCVPDTPPPPPQVCTDPAASNFGGPLPCVFPPPPPDPWQTVIAGAGAFVQHHTIEIARYRICTAAGVCVEFVTQPQ